MVRIMLKKLCFYAVLLLCWLSHSAYAQTQVQILTTNADESSGMLAYLTKQLKDEANVFIADTPKAQAELLIVFGYDKAQQLPTSRVPALFVLAQPSDISIEKNDGVLYWTPSLAAQLALIKEIQPAVNKIGMLANPKNEDLSWLRSFKQYALEQGVEVRVQTVDKSRIGRQVSDLAVSTDILLAQPDTYIYNRETIRFILLAAYRQNKVLIGPSPAFVNAGGLASLYASSESIYEELAQQIKQFISTRKLTPATRVKKMTVSFNPQVAKSLGLIIPDIKQVEQKIQKKELPSWP